MSPYVRMERDGATARLVLARSEKGHAWLADMWVEATRLIEDAAASDDVRVILLDSEGDEIFSGGADLTQLASFLASADVTADLLGRIEKLMAAIEQAPQPVIAVISGAAIGAGLELAAAADIRIASDRARFGIPAARIGVVVTRTDVARLIRVAGAARASDLLLTGRILDADEALVAGIVSRVVPAADLRGAARELAAEIAGLSPSSLRVMKRHLLDIAPHAAWDEAAFGPSVDALTSDDTKARVSRRAPRTKSDEKPPG